MTSESQEKPAVFIASSVEGLDPAYALQAALEYEARVTVWHQGVFAPSAYALDVLTGEVAQSDFGIFLFTPDDVLTIRGKTSPAVRDNVLFELGLFIGGLGRDRCFVVAPRGETIQIASDLAGLSPLSFDSSRPRLDAALGPVAHEIRPAIRRLGRLRPPPPPPEAPSDEDLPAIAEARLKLSIAGEGRDRSKWIRRRLDEYSAADLVVISALMGARRVLWCDAVNPRAWELASAVEILAARDEFSLEELDYHDALKAIQTGARRSSGGRSYGLLLYFENGGDPYFEQIAGIPMDLVHLEQFLDLRPLADYGVFESALITYTEAVKRLKKS